MPINTNSISHDQYEASSSRPMTTHGDAHNPHVGGVLGRTHLTPLLHNPFNFGTVPIHQFQASTSRAPNGNTEVNDVYMNTTNDQAETRDSEAEDVNSDSSIRGDRIVRTNVHHNIARDFHERQGFFPLRLPNPTICRHCRAMLFRGETKNFCCKGGKILLPEVPVPAELLRLFTDESAEGRIFRQNIRAYNHIFSFTSMGVQLDQRVSTGQGVYTFRAHGSIYHRIGTLLPPPGIRPRYIQMFIYDTENEIENRLRESGGLNRELVEKIKRILDAYNPFVKNFRHLSQRSDLLDCKLLIKERPTTERQYTLPTASQVAAIISGGEDLAEATNRDIIVQTIEGRLMNIKEFSGFYDPLQYPLLLPYGTYGWDTERRTMNSLKVTCCDYYAYMLQVIYLLHFNLAPSKG
ncbi:hypothetical protein ACJIZ3_000027 [Penstemon smallii]|uniref:Helitron helicase-like domain-containing protein n=1 Tax=Penstemon smallii TaxID=265156 RepID=A0ABD3RBP3_9LAMI